MVDANVIALLAPDGTPVTNVAFDLSATQLAVVARATGAVLVERHRGAALDVEGVLALRELTALRDELDDRAAAGGHATLVLPLARFALLHDAVDEWVRRRGAADRLTEADAEALPLAAALVAPMTALREQGVVAALGAGAPAA